MHALTKALLGSTCLTALSAGWVQAATILIPELPDSAAAALVTGGAGSGTGNPDLTGASGLTGSVGFGTVASGSGGTSTDIADWFRIQLAPGQQLGFTLTVTPVTGTSSGAAASGAGPLDDAATFPDSPLPPLNGLLPTPMGTPGPVFSQFTFDILDSALNPVSVAIGGAGDTLDGTLFAPLGGGTILFGLHDLVGLDGLDYSFSFTYAQSSIVIVPPPTRAVPEPGALTTMAAGAAAGLGFLRRRRKKR